jgi:hypothetical protein
MLEYEFILGDTGNTNSTFTDKEKDIAHIIVTTIEQMYLQLEIKFPNVKIQIRKYPADSATPMFCLAKNNPPAKVDFINIAIDSFGYWCQAIFQLGHEMTHAAVHYNSPRNTKSTPWIEETISESMSLFFLNSFADAWNTIEEFKNTPQYSTNVRTYLHNQLSKSGSGKLSMCRGYNELKQIDADSQTYREQRKNEMHKLYKLLNSENIKGLLLYRWYLQSDPLLLNTAKYREAFPHNTAVSYLCDLQDSIFFQEASEAY